MDDMKLPEGKTCGQCRNFYSCRQLFACPEESTTCDWSPSRYRTREAEHGTKE